MAGTFLTPGNQTPGKQSKAIAENTAMTGFNNPASSLSRLALPTNSRPYSLTKPHNTVDKQRGQFTSSPAKNIKRLSALRLPKPHSQYAQLLPLHQQPANDASGVLKATACHVDFAGQESNALSQHQLKQHQPKQRHTHNLDMLMLGLSHSRRWVFHLYDRFHVKANYNNLLQVKLNEQTPVVEWVYKILQAGQCAAILLENNGISEAKIQTIKALCHSANVVLVLIEGRAEKLN